MFIYLITNTVNGKQYIGQTLCTPEKRWQEHVYNSRGSSQRSAYPLYHAIRKYGSDSFFVSTLDTAQTQEELNKKEIEFICGYQTTIRSFGYNRHEGGNKPPQHTPESRLKAAVSNRGKKRSEETKKLMSRSAIKRGTPWMKGRDLGVKRSDEARKNMSEAAKIRKPRIMTAEHRQKISQALIGKSHSETSKQKMRDSYHKRTSSSQSLPA